MALLDLMKLTCRDGRHVKRMGVSWLTVVYRKGRHVRADEFSVLVCFVCDLKFLDLVECVVCRRFRAVGLFVKIKCVCKIRLQCD